MKPISFPLKPKLLFLVAEDSYFYSHRLNLGKAAVSAGYTVAVAARCQHHIDKIQNANIQVFPLKHFSRSGLNPFRQLLALLELYKLYNIYQPSIVHHVAMKPVIFGTLIARWCKIPKIINAFGGLGFLFTATSSSKKITYVQQFKKIFLRSLVCKLLRRLFAIPTVTVILQNQDDSETLIHADCVTAEKVVLIRGAGINLNDFPLSPMPPSPPTFIVCIARMLWDKGIGELVLAAKILQEKNVSAKIILWGLPDSENPVSIEKNQLQAWHDSGIIQWQGFCTNVAKAYSQAHIAVLPSYREGLPKSLLEAASCGRPIVTTNVPGCREVVEAGVNGLLVPPQDATSLAKALLELIQNEPLRVQMGLAGRQRIEKYFSDPIIHQQTLKLYAETN